MKYHPPGDEGGPTHWVAECRLCGQMPEQVMGGWAGEWVWSPMPWDRMMKENLHFHG